MMHPQDNPDPFADERAPALTFKSVGTTHTGTVTALPKAVQGKDFETGQPATWPDGKPKWSVVVNVNIDGDARSLWAAKPSALYQAIADAQKEAGARIAVGGTLTVTYVADRPNVKNPRLNPTKMYDVVYVPPVDDTDPGGDLIAARVRLR